MYNDYFGFKEAPFSIAPDPRYLYMTTQHRDALAHLVYGLNSEGGCILLTGEVGTGKTTICRCLLEQIPKQANVALLLNPKVNEIELLESICDELNIHYPESNNSLKIYTDKIYNHLIESNRNNEKTVLIIDEAQNLDSKVLEQLRLLTNLETHQRKLLQIIILGQPELLDILARNEMRQLAQRITARYHLTPLTKHEVKAYINYRLAVAGQGSQLFPESCIKLLFKLSNGIPRLLNILCDRALLGAYVEGQLSVTPGIVKKATKEVFGELKHVEQQQKQRKWFYPIVALSSFLIIATLSFTTYTSYSTLETSNPKTIETNTYTTTSHEIKDIEEITSTKGEKKSNLTDAALMTDITHNIEQEIALTETENTTDSYSGITSLINNTNDTFTSAYKNLFNAWSKNYRSNSHLTACAQAKTIHSLTCLYKQGNINSLKLYNRPAILTLLTKTKEKRYVTITSIKNNIATVLINDSKQLIKLDDLNKHWYGQFTILWKQPEGYTSAITPGASGNIVHWLNTQLTIINKQPLREMKNIYSEPLIQVVKEFQSKQGLTADGIIGPITIIHLNTQINTNTPTLTTSPIITAIK